MSKRGHNTGTIVCAARAFSGCVLGRMAAAARSPFAAPRGKRSESFASCFTLPIVASTLNRAA